MKKIIFRILEPILGKIQFYRFFKRLYGFSARAMNFGQGWLIEKDGELYFLKFLKRYYAVHKTDSIVLFDVGANVGEYTSYLLDVFGKSANVYSFEPSPSTFTKLVEAVVNDEVSNLKTFNIGFSDKGETLQLFQTERKSMVASIYNRNRLGMEYTSHESIVCETIDSFCEENNISKINFLKIDVEGHELNVLQGAKRMIENGLIEFIQFEFAQTNIDSRSFLLDFFTLLSDKYFIYHQLKNGLYKVEYDVIYEVFNVTNYVAISKKMEISNKKIIR